MLQILYHIVGQGAPGLMEVWEGHLSRRPWGKCWACLCVGDDWDVDGKGGIYSLLPVPAHICHGALEMLGHCATSGSRRNPVEQR